MWLQKSSSEISEAIDEGVLECLTLKPVKRMPVRNVIHGSIKSKKDDKIFVEVFEECFDYMLRNCHKDFYDLSFHVNQQPYKMQHNALKFMQEHQLFKTLINNRKYDDDTEPTSVRNGYNFR